MKPIELTHNGSGVYSAPKSSLLIVRHCRDGRGNTTPWKADWIAPFLGGQEARCNTLRELRRVLRECANLTFVLKRRSA